MSNLNQYNQEVNCTYHGEHYLVRDNGAVFRQQLPSKRKRPLDGKWTFGAILKQSGYRKTCGIPVHRIVATAFHGEQPSPHHVVDHIDTNRLNNRPENLRWVTRAQNILDNPKTLKRIEKKWGSLDALFNDPNRVDKTDPITNRPWMIDALIKEYEEKDSTIKSLTPHALQRNWKTPSEFPMCPEPVCNNPLRAYALYLEHGAVFSRNRYGESIVSSAELCKDDTCLSVLCITDSGIKPCAVAKVTFEENKYIHTSVSTYFSYEGAAKSHCEILGIHWEAPKDYKGCLDDYC